MPRLFFWLLPSLLIALLWLASDGTYRQFPSEIIKQPNQAIPGLEIERAQQNESAIFLQLTAHSASDPDLNSSSERTHPLMLIEPKPVGEVLFYLPILPNKLASITLWFIGLALLPWPTMGLLRRGVRDRSMGMILWLELFLLAAMAGLGLWLFHGYWTDPAWWLFFLTVLYLQTYQFEFYCEGSQNDGL